MARARWRTAGIALCLAVASLFAPAGADAAPGKPVDATPVTVFVALDRPSAADEYRAALAGGPDLARRVASAARDRIDALTDELLSRVPAARGARELFRTRNAVAGVALRVDAATARELAARPGVRSVRRLGRARPDNAGAVQLGRALQTWQQTGRSGAGIRIGIIDSGIDYTHADFGGPGTPAAFAAARAGAADFPTAKVIGGIDLAGDDYDADNADPARHVPHPDDNPLDCQGHGTHVAGTAAGLGVGADGTTFRGDHATLTAGDLDGMRIGPGVAPQASLYAIRVFGCSGSTELTALALDHALDPNGDGNQADRLDVVNLSLGSAFGAVDDPVNEFVAKLSEHGVVVVASAGNSGDVVDATGPPGNSPHALTVANIRDAAVLRDAVEVLGPPGPGRWPGQYSLSYPGYPDLDLRARVVALGGANAEGCRPFSSADAERVRGAVVWLSWADEAAQRTCGSAPRAANAHAAGAAGVLLTSGLPDFGSVAIAGTADIPMFQLTGPATAALRPALAAGTLRVRFGGDLVSSVPIRTPEIEDTPSASTSRGVRAPAAKPDVAAPGETITSAAVGTGNGRAVRSGTSMASPFVAGVAALVREVHPGWSPELVKAAIMGTATGTVHAGENRSGPVVAPMRVGAGRVDARAAVGTTLLAMADDPAGAVSVTFGALEALPGAALSRTERVRVLNRGLLPVVLGAAYQPITTMPGVRIDAAPARLVVPPGGSALVDVRLRIDNPAALRRTADPTLELRQHGQPRQYLADASGLLVLTPDDGGEPVVRVPVSAAPKPVSTLVPRRGEEVLTLDGTGVDQGSGPQAYRSRMGVFALAATSAKLPRCAGAAVAGCVPTATGDGGDLRYVGVASTAAAARSAGRPGDALLGFAIATWADLPNIGSITQPSVEIDVDGDGRPDFLTLATKLPDTDVLVARTVDLHRPTPDGFAEVDVQPVNGLGGDTDTNVFDTDVWVLPVRLAALGIDPAAGTAPLRFQVSVLGDHGPPASTDGVVDRMDAPAEFDPLAWALDTGPALLRPADGGTRVSVGGADGPLLVVLGQNARGSRVVLLDAPDRTPPRPRPLGDRRRINPLEGVSRPS
ncbi:S8 family serine peptidase [Pseudonocardia hispaniensis]|uniref:S8 family serine peptidase n=1 Tax=Pseudonocardia hispaniensis TaxID=904933 RepID=A0ABW1J715_9PSEU